MFLKTMLILLKLNSFEAEGETKQRINRLTPRSTYCSVNKIQTHKNAGKKEDTE